MKFHVSAFLAALSALPSSTAWTVSHSLTSNSRISSPDITRSICRPKTRAFFPLLMAGDDDDWFSDYDANAYYQPRSNDYDDDRGSSRGRGGGSRGGGRSYGGGRSRGGGGGHDYIRDLSRDDSPVDEATVNGLLGERLQARKTGDFETADAIRDQLASDYSVEIFDKDKIWFTGSRGGGRGRGRGGGRREGRGGGRGGGRRNRDFGPNGHDYSQASDAGPTPASVNESDIHALIARRLQAKLSRDFRTADRIQNDLMDLGVYVHDKMKEWRADGVPFDGADFGNAGRGGKRERRGDRNRPYEKSEYSEDSSEENYISQMVQERSQAKRNREYDVADDIRDELKDSYNVFIDDRIREWSVGGNFGEEHNTQREFNEKMRFRGFTKSTKSLDLPEGIEEEYVQAQIDARGDAKKNRDYDTADQIRDDLLNQYDVHLNDKTKEWSVGGGMWNDKRQNQRAYTRRGGGNLSEEDLATITDLVAQRSDAKKARNFDVADEIRDQLRDTYEVSLDDRSREWRVDSDEFVQSRSDLGAKQLNEDQIALVQSKLLERMAFKKERDYESADAIRDELRDNYSIQIDDRTKEWRVIMSVGNGWESGSQSSAANIKEMEQDLDDEFESAFETVSSEDTNEESLLEEEEDEEIAAPSISEQDDLSSLTVVQLKEKLREAGKPVSGRKAELIERILA
mmetsp:Transcript_44952/g.66140  ORF Transcript_44952/g.66140 Transcript_44952/m.66140 type:complete len:685 (-) Transcript_44952:38-2092(-)|eukprot:CAMPEP_0195528668 /NCGR_PEP_ID=MMETSP0794_2-20130614/30913_1 /TAXON_ID=515487 /ORGANISM="Stephanopyxis turris, Strain CCMP 815" /LENGTH=684 /DNA_ID=CAMNT_0040659839 /DNA_START=64 /DNA_END=2118 /DNA_ORIENTATION=+